MEARARAWERPLGRTAASSVGSRSRHGPLGPRAGPPAGGISAQRAAVRRKNKRAPRRVACDSSRGGDTAQQPAGTPTREVRPRARAPFPSHPLSRAPLDAALSVRGRASRRTSARPAFFLAIEGGNRNDRPLLSSSMRARAKGADAARADARSNARAPLERARAARTRRRRDASSRARGEGSLSAHFLVCERDSCENTAVSHPRPISSSPLLLREQPPRETCEQESVRARRTTIKRRSAPSRARRAGARPARQTPTLPKSSRRAPRARR